MRPKWHSGIPLTTTAGENGEFVKLCPGNFGMGKILPFKMWGKLQSKLGKLGL